jgi:zinc protease
MKRALIFAAAAFALAACATSSTQQTTTASSAPAPAAASTLHVAPLNYHMRTLPNGLRVYALPDPNTANVSVQVWYNVGSKYDPPNRSGFAHLFEHIMFKATRDLPAESFDRLTEDVGGFNNASTYDDFTNYYEVVPANYLQPILWAEAERMGSLVIDNATFDSERHVVEEELRQRVLASPYGRLFYLDLNMANFSVHPYGRPGIGSIADLDAATVDDVRRFHATYYRPDNAVLVVAGNFDEAQFNQWVDQYFGPITKPARDIPRVTAVEPARAQPADYSVYAPNVPLPAVTISYPQPRSTSPDLAALAVLDDIMATGQDSRLYHALVYDQQVATQVFTNFEATQDPGAYTLAAVLSEGKTVDQGLTALQGEIARVRDSGVTQAELDEAKNEILTAAIENRETAFGRASEIAESVIRYGDAAHADQYLAAVQATTVADVQRVARQIFDDSHRVVLRYQDESKRPAGQTGESLAVSSNIQAIGLTIPNADVPTYTLAPEAQRQHPPAPGAPVSARIPDTVSRTLDNGLRVIVAPNHALPLISADLRFTYGDSADPRGRAGLAEITADLVSQGTTTRSATQVAQQIESIGASLNESSGPDSSDVSLQTRTDRADTAFTVMADVVRNPAFANEELERVRQQSLDGLQVSLSQPGPLASLAMARAIYGDAPYGQTNSPRSLQAITHDDVNNFHAAYWRPDAAVLVISGDVTPDQGFALAQQYFGDWAKPAAPLPAQPDATAYSATPRTIVVDLPGTGQAAVAMGLRGIARRDADYFPLLVANSVLGGGYSARLNEEIRIKRGLSYGAGSNLSARLAPGPIVASAQTRNDAAVQVYQLMSGEIARIGRDLIPADELAARKASLIGGFGRNVETTSGVASAISTLALYGLPPEALSTYVHDVDSVTAEQARDVARRYYDPSKADVVVAGDAAHFFTGLRRLRRNVERIPAAQLNLDSATLH